MLIAEDLLLLVTDDTSGKLSASASEVDVGLGGANLLELTLLERVDLTREGEPGRTGRVVVRDHAPTGDAMLDVALSIAAAHQGKKPAAVINPLSKNLRRALYDRLTARGVLRAEEGRVLGIFPTSRWPSQDARHEAELRRLIEQSLVQGFTPDARTAALIALLHALKCEHKVVDPAQHGLSKRVLRARAEEIAKGNWASDAVRKAIDDMMAAVIAATTAAVVVTDGGAGSS